jgi:hypothetical protein
MSTESQAGAWFTAAARVRRRSHQHRATPEQWEHLKNGAQMERPYNSALCLLELRARVEALEAAQLEQAESHRFCTDAIVRRVEALELAHRIQSGTLTSAERAELGVVPVANLEAAAHRAAAEARDAVMAALSHLSDAEREQTAQELAKPAAWRPLEVETTWGSGDAQRIAQELLKPRAMVVRGSFEHGGKQFSYEAEAVEAERPPHQDKLDRLIALDREDPTPDPATPEPRAASAEAQPGGLVERVATIITLAKTSRGAAEDVLSEAAATARLRDLNGQNVAVMTWEMVARWLEQEANQ